MKQIAILLVLGLTACATDPLTMEALASAHAQALTHAKPTLALTCPNGGCTLEYTDPRDRTPSFKAPTNGWDAFTSVGNSLVNLAGSAVTPLVIGGVAVKGFSAIKDAKGPTTTTTIGDNSGTNAGNAGRIAGSALTDNTAIPTVVTQPTPTVVTQPAPVIVTQPAPVVVK